MKASAIRRLKGKLAADQPVHGLWITLESASIAEMAAALGLDWVVVDAEHGQLDWREILEHIRATVRSQTVCLVRLAELNAALVKRALDLGADGVVIPRVDTPDQLERAIRYAHYPPRGERGIGAERATGWGRCFVEHAREAEQVLVVPLIESMDAAQRIDALARVEGAELFFFGPADFSASAGHAGAWETPDVAERIGECVQTLRSAGKHCGVVATGEENLRERLRQGFRMLALGLDASLLLGRIDQMLDAAGQYRQIVPSLVPTDGATPEHPLPRPPERMRPDRRETLIRPADAPVDELADGVTLRWLAGQPTAARDLMTGIVEFLPGARLPYHRHPCSEAITCLTGRLAVSVEGRRYLLRPLDTITIPRELPHLAENPDSKQTVEAHVALAAAAPERFGVSDHFPAREMPDESTGLEGLERVVRHAHASRHELEAGVSCIHYFNAELLPGCEMSGGWGRFAPGARLPAHVHDFDESICIIEGQATCVVEGRRYSLRDHDTAHVPRGRVHYFVNEGDPPMAMIWVYAGPLPRRLVVAEQCATLEGNPWTTR